LNSVWQSGVVRCGAPLNARQRGVVASQWWHFVQRQWSEVARQGWRNLISLAQIRGAGQEKRFQACGEGMRRLLISKRGDAIRGIQQGPEIANIANIADGGDAIGRRSLGSPLARVHTEGEQGVESIFG
jgi:hypothetical protein